MPSLLSNLFILLLKQQLFQIYSILDQKSRKQALILFGMMVIGSIFEAFSIGMIMPFITVLSSPEKLQDIEWLHKVHQSVGEMEIIPFMAFLGGVMFGLYCLKACYLIFFAYIQNRFIYNKQARLSVELLKTYMHSPYHYFLRRNSAEMLRNLNESISAMFGNGVIPFMIIVSETLVSVTLLSLLLWVEPVVTLVAILVLGTLVGFFYMTVKKRIRCYGENQQLTNAAKVKWANQSMGGIKEIKVLGREDFFLRKYSAHVNENAQVNIRFGTIQKVPRPFLETVVVGGMLLVLGLIISSGSDVKEDFLPTLSLFAMVSFRLMPSVNQIVSAMSCMKFGVAAVNDIYKDFTSIRRDSFRLEENSNETTFTFQSELILRDISYTYPYTETQVLEKISLTVPYGKSVAFVGSSGAGKSTLVDVILGLLEPNGGEICLDGQNVSSNIGVWQRMIGYVPQTIYLSDDSLRKNIAFGVPEEAINGETLRTVLQQACLLELAEMLPEGLDTFVGERGIRLSGGQRQRVGIARALYHDPAILILDEATSSLDNKTESEITKTIEELSGQKTVIIIAHRLTTVKNCDIIYFIQNGRVADSGSYHQLFKSNKSFKEMVLHMNEEHVSA